MNPRRSLGHGRKKVMLCGKVVTLSYFDSADDDRHDRISKECET